MHFLLLLDSSSVALQLLQRYVSKNILDDTKYKHLSHTCHICHFWYTTALFRHVKSTPKVRKFATK